jgi:hypothetical protein
VVRRDHITTTVADDRTVTIKAAPFRAREQVGGIVRGRDGEVAPATRYPLRGKPIRYEAPFRDAAEGDWKVVQ